MDRHEQRAPSRGLLTVLLGAVGAGPLMLYALSAVSDSIIIDLGIYKSRIRSAGHSLLRLRRHRQCDLGSSCGQAPGQTL